jgi:beta-1,4-mannosyl-glycoprotein beta-1,4-N-acetylglucosaminyltransferase
MAIYDCFMFYNELDILELRMNILFNYVDFFVIAESNRTHAGKPKSYHLADNMDRFGKFKGKIRYIQLDNNHDFHKAEANSWYLENEQRLSLIQGLSDAKESDTIILSDLDEIPNPTVIQQFNPKNSYGICVHSHFVYYLNNIQVAPKRKQPNPLKQLWYQIKGYTPAPNTTEPYWLGSCLFKKEFLNRYNLQEIRDISRSKRIKGAYIMDGGWHFSFMGDISFIKQKLIDYAHQEHNTADITNEENIAQKVALGLSLFDDAKFELLPLRSNRLPTYLRENADKFPKLIGKPKD